MTDRFGTIFDGQGVPGPDLRGVITAIAGVNVTIEADTGASSAVFVVDALTRIEIDGIRGVLTDVKVGDMVAYSVRIVPGLTNHLFSLGILG